MPIWLPVTETPGHDLFDEVSVMHPGGAQATAAILQSGAAFFACCDARRRLPTR
jgi:hypothetical protein